MFYKQLHLNAYVFRKLKPSLHKIKKTKYTFFVQIHQHTCVQISSVNESHDKNTEEILRWIQSVLQSEKLNKDIRACSRCSRIGPPVQYSPTPDNASLKDLNGVRTPSVSKKACEVALARRFTLSQNGYGTNKEIKNSWIDLLLTN